MVHQQFAGFNLDIVVFLIVLALPAQVVLVFLRLLCFQRHRQIALCFRIAQLHLVGQHVLGEQPAGQHFLRIILVKHTDARSLADHNRVVFRIKLRNRPDQCGKRNHLFLVNVQHRRITAHPGSPGRGVNGENALSGVQEVPGIAADGEGGKCPALRMGINLLQQSGCRFVENQHFAAVRGIRRVQLFQHGDHHVVRALVDKRNQDFLPVHLEKAVLILFHGFFTDFPDKVPCQNVRYLIAQFFDQVFVDIQRLRGTHVGQGVSFSMNLAFLQEFRNDFLRLRRIEPDFAAAQAEPRIRHPVVQGEHHAVAGQIGGNMVRIGDADVWRRVGADVRDHVVENPAIIGIKPDIYGDVRIQLLKLFNRVHIHRGLHLVGVVLGPEIQFNFLRLVHIQRNLADISFFGCVLIQSAVASAQDPRRHPQQQNQGDDFSCLHPLVPPLETPAIILSLNIRNSTISGTLTTTTAAIMAGMSSRP